MRALGGGRCNPGIGRGLKPSQEELWAENPSLWHVSGDILYTVAIADDGLFLLTGFDRGQGEPAFRSNDARVCVVSMVLQWLSGANDFYPGHSPYEEIPSIFTASDKAIANAASFPDGGWGGARHRGGSGCWCR